MHKTLENIIGCYVTDDHKNWPDLVPVALWTIRSTTSDRTRFSPFTLTFGKDPFSMGLLEVGNAPEVRRHHAGRSGAILGRRVNTYITELDIIVTCLNAQKAP